MLLRTIAPRECLHPLFRGEDRTAINGPERACKLVPLHVIWESRAFSMKVLVPTRMTVRREVRSEFALALTGPYSVARFDMKSCQNRRLLS